MKTFFHILQKLIKQKLILYPDEPFTLLSLNDIYLEYNQRNSIIIYIINQMYYDKHNLSLTLAQTKFASLCSILNNTFVNNELKDDIFSIFSKAQRTYFAFNRLAHVYRHKTYKTVVDTDLLLNPLHNVKSSQLFHLVEESSRSKYIFTINDIVSIVETAITHSPHFFTEPLKPMKPYTNMPLNKSTLYNIYFRLKGSDRIMSLLYHYFFLEDFDLSRFVDKYEHIIRDYYITRYVKNTPANLLYFSVIHMISNNYYTRKWTIHESFPRDKLVEIFRPFLYYHYTIYYGIISKQQLLKMKRILYIKLMKMYHFNSKFGRIILTQTEHCFNDNHISFHAISIHNREIQETIILPLWNTYSREMNVHNDDDTNDDDDTNINDTNINNTNINDTNINDTNDEIQNTSIVPYTSSNRRINDNDNYHDNVNYYVNDSYIDSLEQQFVIQRIKYIKHSFYQYMFPISITTLIIISAYFIV